MKLFTKILFLSFLGLNFIFPQAVLAGQKNYLQKENEKKTNEIIKEIINTYNVKEYNEESKRTICLTATGHNNRYCKITIFDKNNNKIKTIECSADSKTDTCQGYGKEKNYDVKGNLIKERLCYKYNENNDCLEYSHEGKDYKYDDKNNMIWKRQCRWTDKKGNCMGKDEEYNYYTTYGEGYDYTYDDKGHKISEKRCEPHNYYEDGACAGYDMLTEYKYDKQDHLLNVKYCSAEQFQYGKDLPAKNHGEYHGFDCHESYSSNSKIDSKHDYPIYTDDEEDPCLSYKNANKEITCKRTEDKEIYTYNSKGFLIEEEIPYEKHKKYLRDEKGNILVEQDLYGSRTIATEYEYDKNNRIISKKTCKEDIAESNSDVIFSFVKLKENGHCENFTDITSYAYDLKGNLISKEHCDYANFSNSSCKQNDAKTQYVYDSKNNLTNEKTSWNGNVYESTYTYDSDNNLIRFRIFKNGAYDTDDLGYDKVYNKGKKIVKERVCEQINSDGSCKKFGRGKDYIYDKEGNLFMELIVDNDGKAYKDMITYNYVDTKQYN